MPGSEGCQLIGMVTVDGTGCPLDFAGFMVNCGVGASAAEPKPLPPGISSSGIQSERLPCTVTTKLTTARPPIPLLKAALDRPHRAARPSGAATSPRGYPRDCLHRR